MNDPTREEMISFLKSLPFADEFGDDDREVAIYWFANHYHSGQSSNLYEALSSSPFEPGMIANGPEADSSEKMLYDELVCEYTS